MKQLKRKSRMCSISARKWQRQPFLISSTVRNRLRWRYRSVKRRRRYFRKRPLSIINSQIMKRSLSKKVENWHYMRFWTLVKRSILAILHTQHPITTTLNLATTSLPLECPPSFNPPKMSSRSSMVPKTFWHAFSKKRFIHPTRWGLGQTDESTRWSWNIRTCFRHRIKVQLINSSCKNRNKTTIVATRPSRTSWLSKPTKCTSAPWAIRISLSAKWRRRNSCRKVRRRRKRWICMLRRNWSSHLTKTKTNETKCASYFCSKIKDFWLTKWLSVPSKKSTNVRCIRPIWFWMVAY